MDEAPSDNPEGLSEQIAFLWASNKPLAIALIVIAVLLVAGIIFLIVWFAFVNHEDTSTQTNSGVSHMVATAFLHLRNQSQ